MSTPRPIPDVLRRLILRPERGVSGLVEDLLAVCREHNLQLRWQANRCHVRRLGGDQEELIDIPLRKSVFRAVLARVAALCNEQSTDSVSPYGGQGEIRVGDHPVTVFRVAFRNTPSELSLEGTPVAPEDVNGNGGQARLDQARSASPGGSEEQLP
jgi:hypothetical protein